MQNAEAEIAAINSQLGSNTIDNLITQKNKAEEDLKAINTRITDEAKASDLTDLITQRDTAQRELQEKIEEKLKLEADIKKTGFETIEQLNSKKGELEDEKNDLGKELETAKTQINEFKKAQLESNKALEKAKEDYLALYDDAAHYKKKYEEVQNEKKTLQKSLEGIRSNMKSKYESVEKMGQGLQVLKETITSGGTATSGDISKYLDGFEKMSKTLQQYVSDNLTLQNTTIPNLSRQINEGKTRILELENIERRLNKQKVETVKTFTAELNAKDLKFNKELRDKELELNRLHSEEIKRLQSVQSGLVLELNRQHSEEISRNNFTIVSQLKNITELQQKQIVLQNQLRLSEEQNIKLIEEAKKKFDDAMSILNNFSKECPAAYNVPLPPSSKYTVRMFVNNKTKKLR